MRERSVGEGTYESNLVNMFDDELAWKSMATAAARDGSAVSVGLRRYLSPRRTRPEQHQGGGHPTTASNRWRVSHFRSTFAGLARERENFRSKTDGRSVYTRTTNSATTRDRPPGASGRKQSSSKRDGNDERARDTWTGPSAQHYTLPAAVLGTARDDNPLRHRPPGQSPPARPGVLAGATGPARVPPIGRRFAATRPVRRRYRHVFSPPPNHVLPPLWRRVPPPECFEFVTLDRFDQITSEMLKVIRKYLL